MHQSENFVRGEHDPDHLLSDFEIPTLTDLFHRPFYQFRVPNDSQDQNFKLCRRQMKQDLSLRGENVSFQMSDRSPQERGKLSKQNF